MAQIFTSFGYLRNFKEPPDFMKEPVVFQVDILTLKKKREKHSYILELSILI